MSLLWHVSKLLALGSFVFFDYLWFLRLAFHVVVGKLFRKRLRLLEESRIYALCTTHDLDFYGHMNNARYFRELDFGRFDHWLRTPLHTALGNGPVVQHAGTIRFRRSINFLVPYFVSTRLIWWDRRSLYYEQRLQTLHDGFVRAVAITKNTIIGSAPLDVQSLISDILTLEEGDEGRPVKEGPEPREDLATWLKFNRQSSELLWEEITARPAGSGAADLSSMKSFCPPEGVENMEGIVMAQFESARNELHVPASFQ